MRYSGGKKAAYKRWRLKNLETERARNRAYKKDPANRQRATDRENLRRARLLGALIEDIDRQRVYEMHGGMCGICEEFIGDEPFHVDHVVPLSRGGAHAYCDVQPSHPLCNWRKGDR